MRILVAKASLIILGLLCSATPPANAGALAAGCIIAGPMDPQDSGAVVIGPMDPTVDEDLCTSDGSISRPCQSRPAAMRRAWAENECEPDTRANGPWPTCTDIRRHDCLLSPSAFPSLEISFGTP